MSVLKKMYLCIHFDALIRIFFAQLQPSAVKLIEAEGAGNEHFFFVVVMNLTLTYLLSYLFVSLNLPWFVVWKDPQAREKEETQFLNSVDL